MPTRETVVVGVGEPLPDRPGGCCWRPVPASMWPAPSVLVDRCRRRGLRRGGGQDLRPAGRPARRGGGPRRDRTVDHPRRHVVAAPGRAARRRQSGRRPGHRPVRLGRCRRPVRPGECDRRRRRRCADHRGSVRPGACLFQPSAPRDRRDPPRRHPGPADSGTTDQPRGVPGGLRARRPDRLREHRTGPRRPDGGRSVGRSPTAGDPVGDPRPAADGAERARAARRRRHGWPSCTCCGCAAARTPTAGVAPRRCGTCSDGRSDTAGQAALGLDDSDPGRILAIAPLGSGGAPRPPCRLASSTSSRCSADSWDPRALCVTIDGTVYALLPEAADRRPP